MPAKGMPPGFHSLTPHLVIKDCAKAIAWYTKAFGAKEVYKNTLPDGSIIHARLQIGDAFLMCNDEFPAMGASGPTAEVRSPVTIHLYVEDVDAVFNRAVAAGAKVTMPVMDMFWGDRYGMLKDPFNHAWSLATCKEVLSPEEITRRSKAHFAEGMKGGCPE